MLFSLLVDLEDASSGGLRPPVSRRAGPRKADCSPNASRKNNNGRSDAFPCFPQKNDSTPENPRMQAENQRRRRAAALPGRPPLRARVDAEDTESAKTALQ
jgi:hypothetical protein